MSKLFDDTYQEYEEDIRKIERGVKSTYLEDRFPVLDDDYDAEFCGVTHEWRDDEDLIVSSIFKGKK